jgi:hypothetical protein
MTPAKFCVVAAFGLSAAACSYSNTTTTASVPSPYRSGAEQACVDYGFNPGTDSYNRCVVREAQSRAAGRIPADYAVARINADARDACYSYGLQIGSAPYDRCVNREIEARRYRDQAVMTTVPAYPATTVYTPAPAPTVYYTPAPATTVYTPGPVTYAPAAPTPPTGVQAFRDEFGFRYDGQGNRIDAQGNIISPQSNRP